jgi:5-formyltetrahydrofolate cyclo-ligase
MSINIKPESGSGTAIALTEARQRLRKQAIAQRVLQKEETIAAWSRQIVSHLLSCFPEPPGRIVGFCWPVRNEPDLLPLLANWREKGVVLALPVASQPATALRFRVWQPDTAMVTDDFGIPTPSEGEFVAPEVLLIPLNAFDAEGFRLGYGGGYFDRTLAEMRPRPLTIGVGFELGRAPTVWPQAHDVRLDWIVTEAGAAQI